MPEGKDEARAAVASFCGMAMRRLQDSVGVPGVADEDLTAVTVKDLHKIFGEGLEQFTREEEAHSERVNDEDGS